MSGHWLPVPHGSGWAFVVIAVFFLLLLAARQLYIAKADLTWARAHSIVELVQLDVAMGGFEPAYERLTRELEHGWVKGKPSGWAAWNGASGIANLILRHELDQQAAALLPDEAVVARLQRELDRLDDLPKHRQTTWAALGTKLLETPCGPSGEAGERLHRAYLSRLLQELHEADELKAKRLAGLYNRATWLVVVALLGVVALVGNGFTLVLLAGAVGGVLSRMQRLVFTRRTSVTFGSSWTPLFCAPVLGALAAWAGLLLVGLLHEAGVLGLDVLDASLDGLRAPNSATLGLAVLLGVSERFINQLEKQATSVLTPEDRSEKEQRAPTDIPGGAPRPDPNPTAGGVSHDRTAGGTGPSSNGHGNPEDAALSGS